MIRPLPLLLVLVGLGLLLQACNKSDLKSPEWADHTAEYALPLFSTSLSMNDLAQNVLDNNSPNDTLIINPDKTITLIYSGDVTETKATVISEDFLSGTLPFVVLDSVYPLTINTGNNLFIRQADLTEGTVSMGFTNSFSETVTGELVIPTLTKNGQPFTQPFNVAAGQTTLSVPVNLNGWHLETADNVFEIRYYMYLPDGTRVRVSGMLVLFQGLKFSYLEGYWGKQEYALSTDTIDIDINQTNLQGNVKVKNPRVTITVFNSYGFPTRGLIKYLRFRGQNGELIELQSELIQAGTETGIDFAYPQLALGQVGQTKATTFSFDNTNSNIEEIFNAQPTQLIYEVTGLANAEDDNTITGFITDSSTVRLNVKVELLLEGQLKDFAADQTLDLNFGDLGGDVVDSTEFEGAEFKIVTENRIPLTAAVQVYFRDGNDATIDSLFVGSRRDVLVGAPVDATTGLPQGQTRTETFVVVSPERFNRIRREAKKAFLETRFTTSFSGEVPVKFLIDQSAAVRMGVKLKVRQ